MDLYAGQRQRQGPGLTEGQTVTDTITVTVNDGKGGTATQEITVTITGTNDVAKITGQSTGAVIEDNTLLSSGKLTVSDADAGQSSVVAQTNAAGKYGTFSIDANGNWTYSLNNSSQVVQDLKPGQVVKETFEVVSADGSAKQTITIDVVGTNDAPVAANNATSVDVGSSHTFNIAEFNFSDGAEGNNLQSVIITRLPTDGTLTLNGQPVTANTAISAADIAAGKLVYTPSTRARTPRSASRSATTAARPTAARTRRATTTSPSRPTTSSRAATKAAAPAPIRRSTAAAATTSSLATRAAR